MFNRNERPDCKGCKAVQAFYNKPRDCNECWFVVYMPVLMPENHDAVKVWGIVQGQRIIAGMTGVTVDINHLAVWKTIDEYEIENRIDCFEKVLKVAKEMFELEAQERENNKNNS